MVTSYTELPIQTLVCNIVKIEGGCQGKKYLSKIGIFFSQILGKHRLFYDCSKGEINRQLLKITDFEFGSYQIEDF